LTYAKDRHILLTDDDCLPASDQWASLMLNELVNNNSDVVLGFSPVEKKSNSLLHVWSHFESLVTGVMYVSFAMKGWPYMGVGRNLLYRKNLLTQDLLGQHSDLASGDDDLSINTIKDNSRIGVCLDPRSFVTTDPSHSWKHYFNQKRRHFSTAHRYKVSDVLRLSLFSISQIIFYLALFFLFLFHAPIMALCLYFLRIIVVLPIAYRLKSTFRAELSSIQFLFLDVLLALFYVTFTVPVFFPLKRRW